MPLSGSVWSRVSPTAAYRGLCNAKASGGYAPATRSSYPHGGYTATNTQRYGLDL
jgi:hypothetical protein